MMDEAGIEFPELCEAHRLEKILYTLGIIA